MHDSGQSPVPGTAARAERHAITALLIDDEAHARLYFRMLLEKLGVTTVWEAANGEDGVALFARHRPVVVFMDHNMPVMPGEEALKRIRAIDPDAAVVVITAESNLTTVQRYAAKGAIGYLLKFSPPPELVRMVDEILDGFVVEPA